MSGRDEDKLSVKLVQKRSEYDQVKLKTTKLRRDYEKLRGELTMLTREEQAQATDDPLSKRIRTLENRLDKALIKHNEAQSIHKTYDQIVRRLREERVGFDSQLQAIERALKGKERDFEELKSLHQEAAHAKDVASAELERVKQLALEEKEARARELRDKRMHAQARAEMNRLARERETARLNRAAAIAGDLAAEEEEELKAAVEEQLKRRAEVEEETRKVRQKVELYEEAFRRI